MKEMLMGSGLLDFLLGSFVIGVVSWAANELRELRKSVESVNLKIAIVVDKYSNHERQLMDHENRLRLMERGLNEG